MSQGSVRMAPRRVPLVTALPSTPVDGDEVDFFVPNTQAAPTMNGPVVWRLRYRAASAANMRWQFVGGPPLIGRANADVVLTGDNNYREGTDTGVGMTVPVTGTYHIAHGAGIGYSAGGPGFGQSQVEIFVNGAALSGQPLAAFVVQTQAIAGAGSPSSQSHVAFAAGDVIRQRYLGPGSTNITASRRWVNLTPIAIGS